MPIQISLILSILILSTTFLHLPMKVNALSIKDIDKLDKLEIKIAKSYSNKFCNAIGIGISQEGATRLAINENKRSKFNPALWIELASSGEENLSQIDKNKLDHKISEKIVETCGTAIGLTGQKGVEAYEDYFISTKLQIEQE